MSKIRILPEQLVNRIAAGEVVERPASVVKELLENSLDAGATEIDVEIEGCGTRLIRVMDNGEGMDEDDLLLCLERHGTSKLTANHDLSTIDTLGFRGEAIPSIASVSRMTITSRTPDSPLGTKVAVDYGKLVKVHATGCGRGTLFEIRNLFGNTPARRKFLRTSRTELAHIEEVVKNYALAAPDVRFLLRVDEREVCHFSANQTLPQRLAALLRYQGEFLEVGEPPERGHRPSSPANVPFLYGWLLPPDRDVARTAMIRLLVNGRAVRDRVINHAVAEGLRNFLMKGKNPVGLLHLRLPPGDVDVNVHPTKQEVRLRNGQAIHQMVSQTVELAVRRYQKKIQGLFFQAPSAQVDRFESMRTPPLSGIRLTDQQLQLESGSMLAPETRGFASNSMPDRQETRQAQERYVSVPGGDAFLPSGPACLPQTAELTSLNHPISGQADPRPPFSASTTETQGHGLKVIGQFGNLYIFCQAADGGLLVVDQHAAHERLLFEDLKKKFLLGTIASQTLLFPVTVELSVTEGEYLEHHLNQIERLGFSVRHFGGHSYVISAIPAMAGQCDPGELFMNILKGFVETPTLHRKNEKESVLEDILASIACKAAIKAGDQLHEREIDALLTRMSKADLFSHCPHGRPVTKHFTVSEIKKWFHRS